MNTMDTVTLAGKLDDVGEAWINMFHRWGDLGLQAGLTCLVFITMVQKVSVRAGIGALLLMIVALGLYNSREDLANMFEDEVNNPAQGAPAVPGIISPPPVSVSEHTPSKRGGL
ncbi:hypothetical protein OG866_00240 [Streptomyces sp. NBC_00663]|nr:hypothetical protein [Streptomyces sp. NBC_00663]